MQSNDCVFITRWQVEGITFDWRLRAEKPLLKSFSFLLKPLFPLESSLGCGARGGWPAA
jgi:hypothetical protein